MSSQGKLRILYVEDHAETRRAMGLLLSSWGHEVTIASGVAEAKAQFDDKAFDLLLTDLGLPDGDGLEVLRHCREATELPAIALTARAFDDERSQMLSHGFDQVVIKPLKLDQLRRAIDAACPG